MTKESEYKICAYGLISVDSLDGCREYLGNGKHFYFG